MDRSRLLAGRSWTGTRVMSPVGAQPPAQPVPAPISSGPWSFASRRGRGPGRSRPLMPMPPEHPRSARGTRIGLVREARHAIRRHPHRLPDMRARELGVRDRRLPHHHTWCQVVGRAWYAREYASSRSSREKARQERGGDAKPPRTMRSRGSSRVRGAQDRVPQLR